MDRRLRILHVTPSYLPARRYGGTIYATHGLCKALVELGHDVSVFTTNRDGDRAGTVRTLEPTCVDGVTVTYFPVNFPDRLYYSSAMAQHLAGTGGKFDIVHGHSLYLWPGWYASRFCARSEIPYVLSPHGMLVRSLVLKKNRLIKTLWLQLIERNNLRRVAALHFASRLEFDEARKLGLPIGRYFITAHGVDMPPPTALPKDLSRLASERPYILYLGRLSWKKGIEALIRAMVDVPDARLIIAGNDEEKYLPRLRALIDAAGLQEAVALCGPVWGAHKAALMRDARAFVLPSDSENFGIAALEAMSMGCPVVVTPSSGIAEIVAKYGAGIVTEGGIKGLSAAIRCMLEDQERARRCGARGRHTAAELFGWKQIGTLTVDNYQDIIDSYRPR